MPMYDYICPECDKREIDVWEPISAAAHKCMNCQTLMRRAWLTKPSNVIGDECDVWIRHGICNPDGTPRRYRSKAEMKRAGKQVGLGNGVQHIGSEGSDKSPHTTRWI